MAQTNITWVDKVDGQPAPTGVINSANLNEVKTVVNANATDTTNQLLIKANKTLLNITPETELIIAAGVVTATQTRHTLDTEIDAATDNLDTMNGTIDGDIYILSLEDAGRVVTIKHGTGNFLLPGAADLVMLSNTLYMFSSDGTNLRRII